MRAGFLPGDKKVGKKRKQFAIETTAKTHLIRDPKTAELVRSLWWFANIDRGGMILFYFTAMSGRNFLGKGDLDRGEK